MNIILVITLVFVAFLFMQLLPFIKARGLQGRAIPDLSDLLDEEQRRQNRLLLYFWTPHCGMCRGMTPIIDKLAQQRQDVLSINAAQNLELARRFKVMGTPTLVLLADGKIARVLLGAQSEARIHSLLQ